MDAHRLGDRPPVLLAGVEVDADRGVEATSDGDVAAHAVIDALLGAAALGDIGVHFPSSDPRWEGADSMGMLPDGDGDGAAGGRRPAFCDVTVIAQTVRVSPHRRAVRDALAGALAVEPDRVSVKATTTDGLGWLGRDEGIAAVAAVTLVRQPPSDPPAGGDLTSAMPCGSSTP